MTTKAVRTHPLAVMLGPAVELHIKRLRSKGGPDADDMTKAQQSSDMLGERGDVLLCGGGKKGEVANLFTRMALRKVGGLACATLKFAKTRGTLYDCLASCGKFTGTD